MAKKLLNKKETNDTEIVVGGEEVTPSNPESTLNLLSPDTQEALSNIDREEDSKITDEEEEAVKVDTTALDESSKPEKNVKVKLKCDHKCNIGGNWYVFKAGVQYNVPSNVKDILQGAGMLSAI